MSNEKEPSIENVQVLYESTVPLRQKSDRDRPIVISIDNVQYDQTSPITEDVIIEEIEISDQDIVEFGGDETVKLTGKQVTEASSSEPQREKTSSDEKKSSEKRKSSPTTDGNPFNITKLLESEACAEIVSYYNENGRFDEAMRKKLMNVMCEDLIKRERLSNDAINKISSDVCMVFLTEKKTLYFNHIPGKNPSGIFYDMYKNRLKKINKSTIPKKRKLQNDDALENNDDIDKLSDKIKESVQYFKSSQVWDNVDFKTVVRHWSQSFSYRRSILRKKSYENVKIMMDWPIPKTTYSFDLINLDFKQINGPLCSQSFFKNWNGLKRSIDRLSEMISNKTVKLSLAGLPSEDSDSDDVIIAKALHYLMPAHVATTSVVKWSPTMETSDASFYQEAACQEQLEKKIASRKTFEASRGLEPSPIIYGTTIGSTMQYVVVFDDFRFYFDTFLNAFDAAYELISFCNMPYPRESVFWTIVHTLLYDLKSDVTGRMFALIDSLREHMKNSKKTSPSRKRSTESPESSFSD